MTLSNQEFHDRVTSLYERATTLKTNVVNLDNELNGGQAQGATATIERPQTQPENQHINDKSLLDGINMDNLTDVKSNSATLKTDNEQPITHNRVGQVNTTAPSKPAPKPESAKPEPKQKSADDIVNGMNIDDMLKNADNVLNQGQ